MAKHRKVLLGTSSILIGIIVIAALAGVAYYIYRRRPHPPTPPIPPPPGTKCAPAKYCDGTDVPDTDRLLGSKICGEGNKIYTCGVTRQGFGWFSDGSLGCPNGSVGSCGFCPATKYCDGVDVPESQSYLGATICGPENRSFSCGIANGKPAWNGPNTPCDNVQPPLSHMCK